MELLRGNIQNKASTEDWAGLWESAGAGEDPGAVRSSCHPSLRGKGRERVRGVGQEVQP